ncbi:hypothetical protein Cni_G16346 [Canna indica]|uniref:RNase H type-1 domain-containing protein n=1 Tax=Canna indica TaxID=4628 RepID=A0AAQ3KF71_9LILI|nr:hypothetical protein Cni_G16346 [Canna indica]
MVISFYDSDYQGIDKNLHDPVIISVFVAGFLVRKVLVDQGSSVDILFYPTLERMGTNESSLCSLHGELVSFSGDHVNVKGYLQIATTLGSAPRAKMIDYASPYRMILCRPSLNNLGVVVSAPHLAIKFSISEIEVGVIHTDQREARACYNECLELKPVDPSQGYEIWIPEETSRSSPSSLTTWTHIDRDIPRTRDTPKQKETCTSFMDGASNEKGSGFKANNNRAEYEALIARLKLAQEVKARNIVIKSDSQFVIGQVNSTFQARDPSL